MSNHISCATLRNKFFLLYYWLVVLIPLLVKIQETCQYCWCIPQCSQISKGTGCLFTCLMDALLEAQSSVKQQVLILIPQGLQSLPSHGSQSWNLAKPADALSAAFGTDYPATHTVGRHSYLEGNIDSQRSLKTHSSDESGGILPSQLLIVHRLTIQLWNGPRSCGSEDVKRHSNSCVCKPEATLHKQVEHR